MKHFSLSIITGKLRHSILLDSGFDRADWNEFVSIAKKNKPEGSHEVALPGCVLEIRKSFNQLKVPVEGGMMVSTDSFVGAKSLYGESATETAPEVIEATVEEDAK